MNFLLDENFPLSIIPFLREQGHGVFSIVDMGLSSSPDETVFECAQHRHAVLLTTDKDFFHTIPFHYPSHFGVVVISLRQPNRQAILSRLKWFLSQLPSTMEDKVYMLRDRNYVIAGQRQ